MKPVPHTMDALRDTGPLDATERAAAERGDRIEAIKLLRGRTGVDLKTAKDAVEAYLRRGTAPTAGIGLPVEAIASLQEGNMVAAIRATRAAGTPGLKESRDAVLRYLAANPALQQQFRDAAARRRHPWRIVAVLALLVVVALALWRLLRG